LCGVLSPGHVAPGKTKKGKKKRARRAPWLSIATRHHCEHGDFFSTCTCRAHTVRSTRPGRKPPASYFIRPTLGICNHPTRPVGQIRGLHKYFGWCGISPAARLRTTHEKSHSRRPDRPAGADQRIWPHTTRASVLPVGVCPCARPSVQPRQCYPVA
jgi:hypothetical protein